MDNQSREAVYTQEEISNEDYKHKKNLERCKNKSVHSKQFSVEHFKVEKLPDAFRESPLGDLVTRMTKLTVRLHYSFQEKGQNQKNIKEHKTMNADTRNKNYSPDVEYITKDNKDLKQRWDECPKNEHHKEYVSIKTFQNNPWTNIADKYKPLVQLPEFLGCMTFLTGMILVKQDYGTSTGSGFIHKIRRVSGGTCPCHICIQNKEAKKRVYTILTVTTVLHNFDENWDVALESGVFSENWEPKNTTVRLFYDSNDEAHERFIYGYKLLETDKEINIHSDWCSVECVTHDMKLVQKLETQLNKYMELQGEIYRKSTELTLNKLVIIIGHPHGGPKMISVGEHTNKKILKEVRNYQQWCSYEYDITCFGNSGSPIFILGQPLCGFGYWFGHPHNHSKCFTVDEKEVKGGCSSVGVEHFVETN